MSLRTSLTRATAIARPSVSKRFASDGSQHWNPPTGYLFGEKPLPAGQKRKRQAWELPYYIGMGAVFTLATVVYFYKPNTSMQDWALQEAKRRMEARGDLPKYVPSSQRVDHP
ncbi:ESSS subunit of NADH:ubiquinone oxidoreductase-domain-containing protein [Papiliotrema laurentii]|uniref:NADH dehydrogenase [ubiquinone] 1 beta subcomplex subunit 11, mitochondrial n=1 Tax=Papiliotrema laurentii TaxID=5418 RepID=A0AAD9D1L9_PAPLA|nr:ESSS subunit of NADH:ubiquinone oxidoreductase-domain-containing protein [Papiliotrema laurentii]